MKELTKAVIENNNQLLVQVADLMSKYDSADGKSALGECMALMVRANSQVFAKDLQEIINASNLGGAK
ncbi:hypothetical protein [Psychrobacter sp. UBA2514]|jgi:hypothetical protein|uniref:hypothetical protein n=1 Tax=Psychrobacter sp. UBA2514 TaxID=1947346 RepID=UPI002579458E|nr:hypothetical protein [Psychrobacter sp. UBA2514]|tara:strand:+ start:1053 stop:1256 length:204 start_codon:yes stop_codon:yes gene_type:complete